MSDLKYTITKFDNENKSLVVTFENEGWAELRLTKPLPKNINELEALIKQFAAPIEAIEAQTNPDVDLSYINDLLGAERVTQRFQLNPSSLNNQNNTLDPQVEANLRMWEDIGFQQKVAGALVKLGVITDNPTTIPVSSM